MDSREQPMWVFRRIGPRPSIRDSVEVVELKQGAKTFGRGATADVYIDSLVLRNFISRRHAVVVGERNQEGQLQFILHNHGLNGTYVNDVRIGEVQRLQEGDRVIFGHKNGYKVKVGERAEQADSEFQFVLEQHHPGKSGVAPLQEHRQQEYTTGEMCTVDNDHPEPSGNTTVQHGQAVPKETSRQHDSSSMQKRKGSDQGNTDESLPESPSPASSEIRKSRSPRIDDPNATGTKYKTFTGKGSPKVREICSTKENKRSKPKTKQQEMEDETVCRRHSDDGVSKSFSLETAEESSRQSLVNAGGRRSTSPNSKQSTSSSSNKYPASVRPKSPKQNENSGLPFENGMSRSPKDFGARSRLSSSEDSDYRHDSLTQAESTASRSVSPAYASSKSRSVSPLPGGRDSSSSSPSPKSVKNRSRSPKPESLRDCGSRSRSPSPENMESSCVYDEPPVLTPEYVRTPSSVIRTPSPGIYVERDEENFDEVDDIDKDSLLCSIPPTPGRSFQDLSPSPHSSRHDVSPHRKSQEVSLHNRGQSFMSPEKKSDGIVHGKQKSGQKRCDTSVALIHESNSSRQKNKVPERESNSDRKEKVNLHCNQSRWSKAVEPDSTTSFRVRKSSQSDNVKRKKTGYGQDDDMQEHVSRQLYSRKHSGDSHCSSSEDSIAQRDNRNLRKGRKEELDILTKIVDRNVFDKFSASDSRRASQLSQRKRQHSAESDVSGDDSSSKSKAKSPKLQQKHCKTFVEKENGLTPGQEPSGKSREKQASDEQKLKDVRVSVQRVSCHKSPVKFDSHESDQRKNLGVFSSGGQNTAVDRARQTSSVMKGSKCGQKGDRERKDSSDVSLFGLEMERLSAMRLKEKTKVSKERTRGKGDKPVPAPTKNSQGKEKERCRRQEKFSSEKDHEKPKDTVLERSRERRPQRTVTSGSHTPDKSSDDEMERSKPVRKVAVRRPRQTRDTDNKGPQIKDIEQGEKKASRPSRRRRRRKKKTESDEDDDEEEDESLEEGVTWYEEDTCASSRCHRPADRRVQWVCCDDCDSWYHTDCVGIFLEDLKEDEDYHCGCV